MRTCSITKSVSTEGSAVPHCLIAFAGVIFCTIDNIFLIVHLYLVLLLFILAPSICILMKFNDRTFDGEHISMHISTHISMHIVWTQHVHSTPIVHP